MSNPDVSVILPTYNERETIDTAISNARYELANYETEVIVVDDDSPDGTADRVRTLYGDADEVRCIVREQESGLASAVLRGMEAACGGTYAVMDADLQHPASALPRLIVPVDAGRADIAVGSRRGDLGDVAADWPAYRQVVSHGATLLASAAVPPARELTDPMSGFFAVDAAVVDPVREYLNPTGYKILLELLARCPLDEIYEAGYTFHERKHGESNLSAREYVRYVRHLVRLAVPARRNDTGGKVTDTVEVGD